MNDAIRALLLQAELFEKKSKICKDRHFAAASRKHKIHLALGLTATILTALVSSKLFAGWRLFDVPMDSVLSTCAAVATAVLLFLHFAELKVAHNNVGNLYVSVADHARNLIQTYAHGSMPDAEIWKELLPQMTRLREQYDAANREGEKLFTSMSEKQQAKADNLDAHKIVKDLMKAADASWHDTPTSRQPIQPLGGQELR